MSRLRSLARHIQWTPLHPQWLLGRRRLPTGLSTAAGQLLDIGAGDRWVGGHLAAGTRYVTLDFPSTGRDLYGARPDVFADARSLPFKDSSFDGVICLEVLEHVPDAAQVMREVARVLKPGARAWFSIPFLYPLHDAPFDYQRPTEFGIRRDVAAAGMTLERLQPTLHSIRSAGLLACLAIAGGVGASPVGVAAVLLAPAALLVLAINISSFALSLVWPDWTALTAGHEFEVRRS